MDFFYFYIFFILKGNKKETAQEYLKLIENLQESLEWDLVNIYYINGSKNNKLNITIIYKIRKKIGLNMQ